MSSQTITVISDPDLGTTSIVFEVTVIATGLNAMFPDLPTIFPVDFDLTNTSKDSELTPVNSEPSPANLVAVIIPAVTFVTAISGEPMRPSASPAK